MIELLHVQHFVGKAGSAGKEHQHRQDALKYIIFPANIWVCIKLTVLRIHVKGNFLTDIVVLPKTVGEYHLFFLAVDNNAAESIAVSIAVISEALNLSGNRP